MHIIRGIFAILARLGSIKLFDYYENTVLSIYKYGNWMIGSKPHTPGDCRSERPNSQSYNTGLYLANPYF